MRINEIIQFLESIAPPALQATYDNAGLIVGSRDWECTGALVCLDSIEAVIDEAIEKNCNLVVAHHPIVFGGLKKITGSNYVERVVIKAIKNDIAIFAIHTNLDSVLYQGVNTKIAEMIGLQNLQILKAEKGNLKKLFTYAPAAYMPKIKSMLHDAGAGIIGLYADCSFTTTGIGTFTPLLGSNPTIGKVGEETKQEEQKIEMIFEAWKEAAVLKALRAAHGYEEVAYEIISLDNANQTTGSGMIGTLAEPLDAADFFTLLKKAFGLKSLKHTSINKNKVQKIAICGGAGSFLIKNAISAGADVYVTADLKYHEYFDAENRLVLVDIGHYESEQYTINLLADVLQQKFLNFAVLKTSIVTNPVQHYL